MMSLSKALAAGGRSSKAIRSRSPHRRPTTPCTRVSASTASTQPTARVTTCICNFAIEGDVRERIDTDQVNGIGGALNDSTIDGLYVNHTKVGIWLDGPMNNVTIKNTVIADQIADGINFHQGVTNSRVVNSLIRNTGD